jgi:hypothetical protein
VNRFFTAALTASALLVPSGLHAQSADALLQQGIRAYSVREYDGGAWLLRRALAVEGANALSPNETARALMYLTATEVARNQRDSALAAARRLVVIDSRYRPDQNFSSEVMAVVQEARRSASTVSIRAIGDTAIRPGADAFVVRLGATTSPELTAAVTSADGRLVRTLYSGVFRDSIDLRWNGLDASGNAPPEGRYAIIVTPSARERRNSGGNTNWMLRLPLELSRQSIDTMPLPGGDSPTSARLLVGGAVAIAGVAAFLSHHPGQRLSANTQYNRSLRDNWRRNVAEISRRNADRIRQAKLIIRPGAPSLVTNSAGDTP